MEPSPGLVLIGPKQMAVKQRPANVTDGELLQQTQGRRDRPRAGARFGARRLGALR
ncbi:hypothetical protein [Kocuria turfanensis]|uniref:Uncharacterized protein n=1 Tax=Kocuria turfanensis TaxID=388357 RepID=A0A512IGP0_9MICC|nr:hypothetical protein [Kocuria turfanensis]GEO96879.1 hypothetical protein KTU01_30020 [Kocuria turfanensis]